MNFTHLKIFGCVSYVHIDSNARSKLDPKSVKCTFIGYVFDEFIYWFWDDQNRKIFRSKNIVVRCCVGHLFFFKGPFVFSNLFRVRNRGTRSRHLVYRSKTINMT